MKRIKKITIRLVLFIAIIVIALLVTDNSHVLNGITKTWFIGKSKPDIDDLKYSVVREIKNGVAQPWKKSLRYNINKLSPKMLQDVTDYGSIAYLVIHEDSIVSEHYWEDYNKDSYSNSFSMAKSYLATAIGVAIDDGKIKSVDQKVSEFLPWFNDTELNKSLTIKDLLTMASGIDYGESYANPLGFQAKAYYGDDLRTLVKDYDVAITPGTLWKYEGGNSVLLGMILERATNQSVSDYFSEKIWSKIGTAHPTFWSLDKEEGMEKTFSAIYSNARDFARMGKLYLQDGSWEGKQLVAADYVKHSVEPVMIANKDSEKVDYYGYHWWLGNHNGKPFFHNRGMRGQYVIVVPDDDLIVVRLGHDRPNERKDHLSIDTFDLLDEAYRLIK